MSNLLNKASIIITPTGYDTSELLAIKPSNGDGDLDFSRASTATRTNALQTIENVSINVPRIDYTGGVGHILLEPQSTNLITYSEDFSQWNRVNNVALSTDSTVKNPDGTDSTKLTKDSSGTSIVSDDGISISASTTYVFSFFVKKGNFDVVRAEVGSGPNNVNVSYTFSTDSFSTIEGGTQTLISVDSLSFANDWKRICIVFTGTITSVNATLFIGTSINDYVYYFGAQLEQKSFETSYIPTVGSTVTRLGETLTNSGNADLFNDTEGVLYAEIAALADDLTERSISLASGDINNRVTLQYKNVSNQVQAIYRLSSSNTGDVSFTLTDSTQFNKIAFKYKENDFALWVNGVEVAIDNSGSTGSIGITALSFDRLNTNNTRFFGKTKCVAVFKEALTDVQLQCLTS